jgi:hypothetical protein
MSSHGTMEGPLAPKPSDATQRRYEMNDRNAPRERLDLHNGTIDLDAARAGRCGFTQLRTGRVCHLRHRHVGPCLLQG